jgi:hypothetical protein
MIMNGGGRRIAYKTYSAYARFVHHLYEFYIACAARNFQNTDQLRAELAERFIASQTQRILKNRRQAILDGTAPSWENRISHYPENVPTSFARNFRSMRNVLNAYVSTKRASVSQLLHRQSQIPLFALFRSEGLVGRGAGGVSGLRGNHFLFSSAVQRSPPTREDE